MCPSHQRPPRGSEMRAVVTKLMKTSFPCTYSSACPPLHPWADQDSDLAPTCSPCLSPHSLTKTPLISFLLGYSSSNGNLAYEQVFRLHKYLISHSKSASISSPTSTPSVLKTKKDWGLAYQLGTKLPAKSSHKQLSAPRKTASTSLYLQEMKMKSLVQLRGAENPSKLTHRPKLPRRNGPQIPVATNNPSQKPNLSAGRPHQKSNFDAAGAPRPPRTGETQDRREDRARKRRKRT
uniref:Uncharacterized protein n=1 Tax=Arundo donax TaxID=35708 RepID=A0A0A9GNR8_ARUDO